MQLRGDLSDTKARCTGAVCSTSAHRQEQQCRATPVHVSATASQGILGMIKDCFLFAIGAVLLQDFGQLTASVPPPLKRHADGMVCSFIYLSNVLT